MKTKTVTVREGERLSDIDWSFDFQSHDWNHGGCTNHDCIKRSVEYLKEIESRFKAGEKVYGSSYGGWPRIWQQVVDVGMWDGWPYWKPMPSICLRGPCGVEWQQFPHITGCMPAQENKEGLT
jgi:hypothetical protein